MGRKTWESLPEKFRPLPNRKNVIITRQTDYAVPAGVEVFNSLDEAYAAHSQDEVMVMGGAQIYAQALERARRLYVTHVEREVEECAAFFPAIDPGVWLETNRESHPDFSFVTYERK
jgi:dihydrofolate reductase